MDLKPTFAAALAVLLSSPLARAQTSPEAAGWGLPDAPPPATATPSTPPPPPPAPPPPARQPDAGDPAEHDAPCKGPCPPKVSDRLAAVGLRVSRSRGSGDTGIGVSFAGRLAQYSNFGSLNTRETLFWNLGGGGAGFEGAFGAALAAGGRLAFDRDEGLVFRLGAEGYAVGDDAFYASMFEIPQGQIGYQLLRSETLFEVGGKVGAVVTGRLRDPAIYESRKYPFSAEWGAYGSLDFAPVRVDVAFTRYETRGDAIGTPIHLVSGALCGLARVVSLCVDARFERGDIPSPAGGAKAFESLYGGMTVGFGYRPEKR